MNEQTATTAFTKKPRFIVSISGGKRRDMNATLDSLRAQTYGEWAEDAAEQSFPHDYALRIHAGDTLHPDALFRMAHAVERAEYEPDMIYADELIQEGKKPYEEHKNANSAALPRCPMICSARCLPYGGKYTPPAARRKANTMRARSTHSA